jgi:hypothetical protein
MPYKTVRAGVGAYNGWMLIQPYLKHIVACNEAIGGSGVILLINAPLHSGIGEAFFLPTCKAFYYKLGL